MVLTVKQFLGLHRPGLIFGAIIGFFASLYLETITPNDFLGKLLEYNTSSKGILIMGIFAGLGLLLQWYMRWT